MAWERVLDEGKHLFAAERPSGMQHEAAHLGNRTSGPPTRALNDITSAAAPIGNGAEDWYINLTPTRISQD